MTESDRTQAFCIIGSGASGLAAAKALNEWGIPFDCLEREADIGGLWNAGTPSGIVYETTHLVSASRLTGFEDFPMDPERTPIYPGHRQVLEYLKSYARANRLGDHIELSCRVKAVEPLPDGRWSVCVDGEAEPRIYRGVIAANGHHDLPRMPTVPGSFSGEVIHSRDYKSAAQLAGKRVLVVGAGNSGCDIIKDAAPVATRIMLSIRRGYWFMPKFILGYPTQVVANFIEGIPMPRRLRRFLYESAHRLLVGPAERYGLPKPNYHFDESHPTMSDEIPRLAAHGRLEIKPKIVRFEGSKVHFGDGSAEDVDLVIFATGYQPSFPFLKSEVLLDAESHPLMHLHVFHPKHDTLFACGLSQANGSMWRVAEWQAGLIARYIAAQEKAPELARWFRAYIAGEHARLKKGRWFVPAARHALEVNYYDYQRLMKRITKLMDKRLKTPERVEPQGAGSAPLAIGNAGPAE